MAAPAARSSAQSGSSPTTAARLALMVPVALARLRRSWASPRASLAASGNGLPPRRCPTPGGAVGMPRKTWVIGRHLRLPARVEARISARWTVRTPVRSRDSPPPMCSRQELSEAEQTSARVESTLCILSASMAAEVSGFLTANVPPKPQQASACGQLDQVDAADLAQQPQRPVPDPQHPQAVAGRVVGHPVRVVGADVGDPEHVDQELRQLEGARGHLPGGRRQPGVAGLGGQPGVLVADRPGARPARGHHRVVAGEGGDVPAHQRHRLREVAGVDVHLPAAGLGPRHLDGAAEPLQQPHRRLADVREQPVHQTGHEQGDTHARPSTALLIRPLPRGTA